MIREVLCVLLAALAIYGFIAFMPQDGTVQRSLRESRVSTLTETSQSVDPSLRGALDQ
ncbi:hypothetical protein FHS85_002075 [Rhodoligotrophos appendicifer]|uniref:hypothetical protein n=1 Tax=Rhodoligotrophos appendicifer TaxID=987056 RepID=UPI001479264C|nr:hypothetical protein [Rhodoligotrophos appendicifer]